MRHASIGSFIVCWIMGLQLRGARAEEAVRDKDQNVADPWNTRGTLMLDARLVSWRTDVPLPGLPSSLEGTAPAVFLSTDLYGRHLGFDLSYRALSTETLRSNGMQLNGRMALAEVQPDFNVVVVNRKPLFLSAGIGLNVRLNVVDIDESFSRAVASWQTITLGANVRARAYLGRRLYATGSLFVGALPLLGSWQSAGVTSFDVSGPPMGGFPMGTPQPYFETGSITNPLVVNFWAAASARPLEWLAVTAGLALRRSSFDLEGRGSANELDVQPFAGVDFLY